MSAIRRLVLAVSLALIAAFPAARAEDSSAAALAALAAGGQYGLMRHAYAPGKRDARDMRIEDCATQRNLDAGGRAQAAAIGAALRRRGITIFKVYASRWCRGLETANLLAVGDVEPLDILNSFFDDRDSDRERGPAQTKQLAALVSEPIRTPSVLLVTHRDNVKLLTALDPEEGEIVVVRPLGHGRFDVVGRVRAEALEN